MVIHAIIFQSLKFIKGFPKPFTRQLKIRIRLRLRTYDLNLHLSLMSHDWFPVPRSCVSIHNMKIVYKNILPKLSLPVVLFSWTRSECPSTMLVFTWMFNTPSFFKYYLQSYSFRLSFKNGPWTVFERWWLCVWVR